jgi:hypothetical protein
MIGWMGGTPGILWRNILYKDHVEQEFTKEVLTCLELLTEMKTT